MAHLRWAFGPGDKDVNGSAATTINVVESPKQLISNGATSAPVLVPTMTMMFDKLNTRPATLDGTMRCKPAITVAVNSTLPMPRTSCTPKLPMRAGEARNTSNERL